MFKFKLEQQVNVEGHGTASYLVIARTERILQEPLYTVELMALSPERYAVEESLLKESTSIVELDSPEIPDSDVIVNWLNTTLHGVLPLYSYAVFRAALQKVCYRVSTLDAALPEVKLHDFLSGLRGCGNSETANRVRMDTVAMHSKRSTTKICYLAFRAHLLDVGTASTEFDPLDFPEWEHLNMETAAAFEQACASMLFRGVDSYSVEEVLSILKRSLARQGWVAGSGSNHHLTLGSSKVVRVSCKTPLLFDPDSEDPATSLLKASIRVFIQVANSMYCVQPAARGVACQ